MHRPASFHVSLLLITALGCAEDPTPAATPDAGAPQDTASGDTASEDSGDAGSEPTPSTLDFPVDAPGPLAVGYRTLEHTYTPAGVGEPRTIVVHVWYPAEPTQGEHPTWMGLFTDDQSVIDAPAVAPVDGVSYPVHVYSHGHQGFGATSWQVMRWFASHGWVAVAPDHAGDLLNDPSDANTVAHYLKRPQDVSQALDRLAALDAADPLSRADTSRVVLSGHSRGSYTVWASSGATYDVGAIAAARPDATPAELEAFQAGFDDPRVVAVIPMAGAYRAEWFGADGYLAADVPVLAMTGSEDNPESAAAQWAALGGIDLTWIELQGGCHQAFALGFCDNLPDATAFHIVNTYALAFARAHVLADDAETTTAILDGSAAVDPAATFQRKTP